MTSIIFSIIIPLYNSDKYIRECLQGILSQDYPHENYEVIVVDNGSTDKSIDIVREFDRVGIYSLPKGNISEVRNYGASFANGEILGFVDSDCVVAKDWVTNSLKVLSRDKNVAATGANHLCPENETWVAKAWFVESKFEYQYVEFIASGNFIIRSLVFNKLKGFNKKLETCEDADLCERITLIGYKLVSSTNIKNVHLRNCKTLYQMFLKEMWYGKDMMISVKNKLFDKVFVFTITFLSLHLITLVALLIGEPRLVGLSLSFLFALISLAALNRVVHSTNYAMFFHIIILYYVYFLARSSALLIGSFNK